MRLYQNEMAEELRFIINKSILVLNKNGYKEMFVPTLISDLLFRRFNNKEAIKKQSLKLEKVDGYLNVNNTLLSTGFSLMEHHSNNRFSKEENKPVFFISRSFTKDLLARETVALNIHNINFKDKYLGNNTLRQVSWLVVNELLDDFTIRSLKKEEDSIFKSDHFLILSKNKTIGIGGRYGKGFGLFIDLNKVLVTRRKNRLKRINSELLKK